MTMARLASMYRRAWRAISHERRLKNGRRSGPLPVWRVRHNTPAVVYTCLGAAFLVAGVLVCFIPPDPRGPRNAMLIGGLVVANFGALCLIIGVVRLVPNLGASWHLHEHGVRLVGRSGKRVLPYKDVDELTLKVVRVFFHGVCTGEVHDATFKSHGPANKVFIKQVRRPSTISGADLDRPGELAKACDKVAELIANRMAARLLAVSQSRGSRRCAFIPTDLRSNRLRQFRVGYPGARLRESELTEACFSYGSEMIHSRLSRCRPICRISSPVTG